MPFAPLDHLWPTNIPGYLTWLGMLSLNIVGLLLKLKQLVEVLGEEGWMAFSAGWLN